MKDGILCDAKALLEDVREIVAESQKGETNTPK